MRTGVSRTGGEKKTHGPRFRVPWGYVILAIVLVFFTYKFIEKVEEVRHLSAQEAALRHENQQTAGQNRSIQQALKYYQTTQYVESQARALFGYTRPGDIMVEVQPHYQHVVERAAPPTPIPTPAPVWRQWVHAILHRG